MTKEQIKKYAEVLVWGMQKSRKKHFKLGDVVYLRWDILAQDLAEAVHQICMSHGWNVVLETMYTDKLQQQFYKSSSAQRKFKHAGEDKLFESFNGKITIYAPTSLTHLKYIDPDSINEYDVSHKYLDDIIDRSGDKGKFGWTLCTYPTAAQAKYADMTLKQYEAQIIKACWLNEAEPVKKWEEIHAASSEIKNWLNSLPIKTIHINSLSCNLDITLGEKRKFMNANGANIPSYEIYTSPDWRGTSGKYHSDLPTYWNGNYVEHIDIFFEKGRAIEIVAEQGNYFINKTLRMDAGAAQIGEFSLTDKRFSKIDKFMADLLFDENFGGTNGNCHIAMGSAYSDTYAGNPTNLNKKALGFNDSALHWDLVNTEKKTVTATLKNGKKMIIYENGMFHY